MRAHALGECVHCAFRVERCRRRRSGGRRRIDEGRDVVRRRWARAACAEDEDEESPDYPDPGRDAGPMPDAAPGRWIRLGGPGTDRGAGCEIAAHGVLREAPPAVPSGAVSMKSHESRTVGAAVLVVGCAGQTIINVTFRNL